MHKHLNFVAGILLLLPVFLSEVNAQTDNNYNIFSKGFKNPPTTAHPIVYHWWLGGNVDTLRLRKELISMKEAGISGLTIFEIGTRDTAFVKQGPAFLGEESLQVIKFAIEEAGKSGMEVGLNTASSWNAGGNWIPPEHAAKSIYFSKTDSKGETNAQMKLPFPEIPKFDPRGRPGLIKLQSDGKPVFYEEIAVLAIPERESNSVLDISEIINVTRYFNPETETLYWETPPGKWKILRFICSNSGENLVLPSQHSAGPVVDHFDSAATEFHFLYIINRLKSVLGDLSNTALKSLYMASYEAKGSPWTTTLPAEFFRINGYNIYKYLPLLFSEAVFSPVVTKRFMADYQSTLSELMINNFYKKSREICNAYGLKNNCEAGGPGLPLHNVPVEPLKALGALDIPRGEFWINNSRRFYEGIDVLRVVKEVSSASHIYGRGIVEMEAFTTFQHWQEGPFEMKPFADRAFCEGMNKVVVHGSTHNPSGSGYPGIGYYAGVHYNDKRVWWPKVKPFNEYLSRISYILQEADFVADLLYYYGDTIPNYGGHKNSRFSPGPGYDYEIINTEVLNELIVKDGKLVIPRTGAQFSLLVLTDEYEINPEVLVRLHELVEQGAVITGQKPTKVALHKNYQERSNLEKLRNELWTDFITENFQKKEAKVYSGTEPSVILESLDVFPDFSYLGEEFFPLDYTHYSKEDMDFYFVRNTTNEWISRDVIFRQEDKIPEIWDPVSGDVIPVSIYNQSDKCINIPVSLAPYSSIFVVFKNGHSSPLYKSVSGQEPHPPLLQYTKEGICFLEEEMIGLIKQDGEKKFLNRYNEKKLEGPWELFFPEGWGAPGNTIFPKLVSWTESDNPGIKYFSGIARYELSFLHTINSTSLKNPGIYLDLGELSHIGEVWLNDHPLGITWCKPHRFDITDVLLPGQNKLIIEVGNTWSNRIVGDIETGEKFTQTNVIRTSIGGIGELRIPWEKVPLIESGLFGPVTIITIEPVNKVDEFE